MFPLTASLHAFLVGHVILPISGGTCVSFFSSRSLVNWSFFELNSELKAWGTSVMRNGGLWIISRSNRNKKIDVFIEYNPLLHYTPCKIFMAGSPKKFTPELKNGKNHLKKHPNLHDLGAAKAVKIFRGKKIIFGPWSCQQVLGVAMAAFQSPWLICLDKTPGHPNNQLLNAISSRGDLLFKVRNALTFLWNRFPEPMSLQARWVSWDPTSGICMNLLLEKTWITPSEISKKFDICSHKSFLPLQLTTVKAVNKISRIIFHSRKLIN